ncbi:MAG: leucine-rich repeat domain-containing protein [Planctomycetaceae bacterium]
MTGRETGDLQGRNQPQGEEGLSAGGAGPDSLPSSKPAASTTARDDSHDSLPATSDEGAERPSDHSGSSRKEGSRRRRRGSGRRRRRESSGKSEGKKVTDQLGPAALLLAILSVIVSIPLQEAIPGLVLGLVAFLGSTILVGIRLIRNRRSSLGMWALGLSLLAVGAGLFAIRRERALEQKMMIQRAADRLKEEEELIEKSRRLNPPKTVGGTVAKPPVAANPAVPAEIGNPPPDAEPEQGPEEDPLLARFGVPTVPKADDSAAVALLRQRGLALKQQVVSLDGPTEDQAVVTEIIFLSPRASDELLRAVGPALSKLPNLRILNLFGGEVSEAGLAALLTGDVLSEITLPQASDPVASQLSRFRNLRKVVFDRRGSITDDGLAQLAQLTRLRRLDLGATRDGSPLITDASARSLRQLTALRELILPQTALTPEGIQLLGGIARLEQLDLTLNEVTDASLSALGDLKNLRSLKLRGTQVQGSGLQYLARCQSLESLQLSELSPFESDELRHLVGHPRLKALNLSGTRLDKRAINHLQGSPTLELLELNDSGVGEADLRELRAALPKCTVEAVKLFTD